MKKSVYSSFLLLFFTCAVVIGYQNCGAVGGTSPFTFNPGPGDGIDDLDNPALLKLTAEPPTANGRVLTINFRCDYSTFLDHNVYIQVTGANNFAESWSTKCTGSSFTYTRTMQASFNPSQYTYQMAARLVAIASNGEEVTHANATVNPITIGVGVARPVTIDRSTDWTALNANPTQDVSLLGDVPGTYSPYIGVVGKIEFTASTTLPLHTTDNIYYGLMEFLPYKVSGAFRPEFSMAITHRKPNSTAYYEAIYYPSGTQTTPVFEAGNVYVINFVFQRSGNYAMYIYKKSNSTVGLLSKTGAIAFSPTFGTEAMQLKWGKNSISSTAHSGFTNAKLKWRICGYVNGYEDLNCLSYIND